MQLRRFGLNPGRIQHIFISHLHGDHIFGLFGLLSSLGLMGRKVALNLYGPEAMESMLLEHFRFFGAPPFELIYHIPSGDGGVIYEDNRLTVLAIPLKHRTTTFGYLFKEKKKPLNVRKDRIERFGLGIADLVKVKQGEDHVTPEGRIIPNAELTLPPYHQRSYAYVSDTVYDPKIAEHIRGVDLLFHEATFSGKDGDLAHDTLHSTAEQAAMVARAAEAERLIIGHFSTRYKDPSVLVEEARAVFPDTEGVNDGDVFSLPLRREGME
jgi:ribonuclease Z